MALSDAQKKSLAKQSVQKLLQYIDAGNVSFPDDFIYVDKEKTTQVKEELDKRPNPKEVAEWNIILAEADKNSDQLEDLLKKYLANWEISLPSGNHVAEAKAKLDRIAKDKADAQVAQEQADWDNLELLSKTALINYIGKYPNSVHKHEIDDSVWALTLQDINILAAVQEYLKYFRTGLHAHEAQMVFHDYENWQPVKNHRDLMEVFEFIGNYPQSLFINEAKILLLELKQEEIEKMKKLVTQYDADTLLNYLSMDLFSENELLAAGVVTTSSLEKLRNLQKIKGSIHLDDVIESCLPECADDRTDVFFFGIPSTGKSCILMGLIGSQELSIDTVRAGGPYADALSELLDAGMIVGHTPADFIATIQADIPNGEQKHKINLVEMAGEDFANKLAKNEDGAISFEDMGNGASILLSNNNRKAFFIIVDPTARIITRNKMVKKTDEQGNEVEKQISVSVNQRTILRRMVGLFKQPENENIMKRVDSIHIIVTKADTLGNNIDREEKAYQLFMNQYRQVVIDLADLCQKFGINVATNGFPKLYTFSLGTFYIGDVYDYDPTDACKLVNVIRGNVWGEKNPTFIDKLRHVVNKPIF